MENETKQASIEETKIEIGTEEATKLKPQIVNIVSTSFKEVQTKNGKQNKIVVCQCKHPEKNELINISTIKIEKAGGKLENTALWLNKDSKGLIRKNSPLAILLQKTGSKNIEELKNKNVETTTDEQGYLNFKAY